MRHLTRFFPVMLMIFSLALAGCGSSSSGSTPNDPLAADVDNPGTDPGTTPITAQDPKVNLSVLPDRKEIDANIGTVILTAKLLSAVDTFYYDPVTLETLSTKVGDPIPNKAVTFTVISDPAIATITYTTPVTDKNGASAAILKTGNVNYTTNVIIEASTTVDGNVYRAYTTIQLVRGTSVIKFLTTATSSDPSGTLNTLSSSVKYDSPATAVIFPQLIPFKVTDSNGNPRVGVPVTLDMYSQSGTAGIVINYLKNGVVEPSANTVTTDSSGAGIFNITVTAPVPVTPGFTYSEGVVYRAVTNDAIPLTAYGGFIVSSTRENAPVVAP